MSTLYRAILTIDHLLAIQPQLAAMMGSDWPAFAVEVEKRLEAIALLTTEAKIETAIDQLLFFGWQQPNLREFFTQIMQAVEADHAAATITFRDSIFTLRGSKGQSDVPTIARFQVEMIEAQQQWQQNLAESPDAPSESSERFLNAGFYQDGSFLSLDKPLLLTCSYDLLVNVGAFWGIGTPDVPFPDELVAPYFEADTFPLTVVLSSPLGETVLQNPVQILNLPQQGDSEFVYFSLTFSQEGRLSLSVDLLYSGHLLQTRQLAFRVVANEAVTLPPSAWPVQDSHISFTRSTQLNAKLLARLGAQPRQLTIISEREPQQRAIGLRFYSNGEDLGLQVTQLQESNLAELLTAMRTQLQALMDGYHRAGGQPLAEDLLTSYLGWIGYYGRSLYRAMFPGHEDPAWQTAFGQKLQAALNPDTIIQIAPLTTQLSIPWELVYERPLHRYSSEQTRLCSNYHQHGPQAADCPHQNDGYVICPHGFWGYQYIIEQLPGRLSPGQQPKHKQLPQWLRNTLPLEMVGIGYADFPLLPQHWQQLAQLASPTKFHLHKMTRRQPIEAFLQDNVAKPQIIYFYAHGGKEAGMPYLKVANDLFITPNDLDAWNTNWRQSSPLLILNACDSANYDPDSFENLLQEFYQRGASGILGTQCTIYEELVEKLMLPFLKLILAANPVGQALLQVRRQLMFTERDPRGLAYSLIAAAELKFAESLSP